MVWPTQSLSPPNIKHQANRPLKGWLQRGWQLALCKEAHGDDKRQGVQVALEVSSWCKKLIFYSENNWYLEQPPQGHDGVPITGFFEDTIGDVHGSSRLPLPMKDWTRWPSGILSNLGCYAIPWGLPQWVEKDTQFLGHENDPWCFLILSQCRGLVSHMAQFCHSLNTISLLPSPWRAQRNSKPCLQGTSENSLEEGPFCIATSVDFSQRRHKRAMGTWQPTTKPTAARLYSWLHEAR